MPLYVTQSPINPDPRGWWGRITGEPWQPLYAHPPAVALRMLHDADQQNRLHAGRWRGRIGKITLRSQTESDRRRG